jgi:hypothetical protein
MLCAVGSRRVAFVLVAAVVTHRVAHAASHPPLLQVNGDGLLHSTYHWQPNGWCGDKPSPHPHISAEIEIGETWDNALHEYAVEYTPDHIHFALDGVVFETITTANMSSSDKDRAQFFPVPYCESAP